MEFYDEGPTISDYYFFYETNGWDKPLARPSSAPQHGSYRGWAPDSTEGLSVIKDFCHRCNGTGTRVTVFGKETIDCLECFGTGVLSVNREEWLRRVYKTRRVLNSQDGDEVKRLLTCAGFDTACPDCLGGGCETCDNTGMVAMSAVQLTEEDIQRLEDRLAFEPIETQDMEAGW